MQRPVYEASPFPLLVWDNGWNGEVFLAQYGSMPVSVASDDPSITPTVAQARAFTRLLEQNKVMDDAVIRAVFEEYPRFRQLYKEFDAENAAEAAPPVSSIDGLERLIDLLNVHVLDVEKDGEAYVGFEFACTWDEEHGLGVMTHAGRVVEVGQADTSFCTPEETWNPPPSPAARPAASAPSRGEDAGRTQAGPRRWWEFWRSRR